MTASLKPRHGAARAHALRRSIPSITAAGLLTAGTVMAPSGAASAATTIGNLTAAVADDGAKVIAETLVDARTVDLTIQSPAVGRTTARLLLPKDWANTGLKWPTLYALHGANDANDYKSWTVYTDISAFMKDKNVLTVMPSDGPNGCYSDWYNPLGLPGVKKWETYHTVELPQILQRGYRSNNVNAVAGISIGGYGALIYAARHPGMYKMAASYSGLTNVFDLSALVGVTTTNLRAGQIFPPWGPMILAHSNWVAHNPIDQAAKFKGTALYVSSGDGKPGPLDDPNFSNINGSRLIESLTSSMNKLFVERLQKYGIPVTANLYTGGYHLWPYWQREFHTSWPMLATALGAPTPNAAAAPAPSTSTGWWHAIFG